MFWNKKEHKKKPACQLSLADIVVTPAGPCAIKELRASGGYYGEGYVSVEVYIPGTSTATQDLTYGWRTKVRVL